MSFEELLFRFFIFWYISGVILLTFDLLPAWLEWANAVFLILAGLLSFIYFVKIFGLKFGFLISSIVFLFSFFIEYLGAKFGLLFGSYHYTDRFAPNLFNVPVAIGFAWLMVIGTTHVIAKKIVSVNSILYPIVGGFCAVVIDLIIDPVAFKVKQYWIWTEKGMYYDIPFTNFVGWFVVAFTLHLIILIVVKRFKKLRESVQWERRMILLFYLMISMFVLLGFKAKLYLASFLTSFLSISIIWILYWRKKHD